MASHVTNVATEYEDPTPIRSRVTSYNVSHWLPLKMRTRQLRMRGFTWPVSKGWKTITFFGIRDPGLPIHYTTSVALRWIWLKLSAKVMHGPVLKTYEFLRMREITWSVKGALNDLLQSLSDFKSWTYSLTYGHFQQHLYCACAETVIYELPV